jgi:hypothetical protein
MNLFQGADNQNVDNHQILAGAVDLTIDKIIM